MPTAARTAPLVYLVGASGAGKDTLLDAARKDFAGDPGVMFARRHVTCAATRGGEDHIPINESTFASMADDGEFLLHWHGNGLRYGIHRDYGEMLHAGRVVIVNGSRAYLDEARRRCPGLWPVLLRVEPELLRQRLVARGRESPEQIDERLQRTRRLQEDVPADATVIDNSGAPEDAMSAFSDLLRAAAGRDALSAG